MSLTHATAEQKSQIREMSKEVIYVYNEQHAIEVLNEEIERGTNFELNCVKKQQRVCSSADDIRQFYAEGVNHD